MKTDVFSTSDELFSTSVLMAQTNLEFIRVVLADDHKLVRAGFRLMLNSLGAVEIVGETGNGLEALELIRMKTPQLAFLDITMPGLTGIEVAVRIQRERLPTKIVILS